jgi:hypothetical protein
VGLRQTGPLSHDKTVNLAILDDPEQVHPERPVNFIDYFLQNRPRALLL